MSNDTREQFEAHFKLSTRQARRDNAGEYIDEKVRDKWEGWQAAVASIAGQHTDNRPVCLEGWQIVAMPDGWTDMIDVAIYWARKAAPEVEKERLYEFRSVLAAAPRFELLRAKSVR